MSAGLVAGAAGGAELRLDEDRISLKADGERLHDVLKAFERAGVEVQIEPGIDALIHGELLEEEMDEGLKILFGHFNYVLFWRRIEGPLGPLNKLSGMHLFRPGKQQAIVPFAPGYPNLEVVSRRGIPPHVKDEILLGMKPGTTPKQFKELLASIGATVVNSIPAFGIYQIRLPHDTDAPALAQALAGNPWVAVAEPNYVHQVPRPVRVAQEGAGENPPAYANTSADSTREIEEPTEGAAALAVFDSGLAEVPGLGEAVVGTYDAVDPSRTISDPVGHGTQMALIASGVVLPHGIPESLAGETVRVLAVRAFDDAGRASNFSLLRGIDYAISEGARVISMSWGTETNSEFLESAIRYAQDQQMIVVASAGNEPIHRPVYPAAYSGVLAISALQADGSLWQQSNYGSFVFAAAPGTGEFPVGYEGPPGNYIGTSIASPTVARALTQYLTANPGASPEDAVQALQGALTDIGDPGRDERAGYGALDCRALEAFLKK